MDYFKIAALIFLGLWISSCGKKDPMQPNHSSPETLKEFLLSGDMRITEFREDGEDYTAYFQPWVLRFQPDGTVLAVQGSNTLNGTFLLYRDDGKTELYMWFPGNGPLYELDDDWYFISRTDNRIHFQDSGDVLKLEKI